MGEMMKYSEIEKFTSSFLRGMPISINLTELQSTLDHFKESYGLNMNPDFQRGHVWTIKQQSKYIEFLLRGGKTNPIYFNSPVFGGYTSSPLSDIGDEVVIVDGLQRITAIQKFLNNEVPVFVSDLDHRGYLLKDFQDPEIVLRKTEITYQVNTLSTRKSVLTWYLEINNGGTPHSEEELERVKCLLEGRKFLPRRCEVCRRDTQHVGFDGCMNGDNCPYGFEPCF